jgi:hypothetical protein
MPVTEDALHSLLRSAVDTEAALAGSADEQAERARGRLRDSVCAHCGGPPEGRPVTASPLAAVERVERPAPPPPGRACR